MTEPPVSRRWFRLPPSLSTMRREVDHEIEFHIEQRTQALIEDGVAPEEARARAAREFGDVDAARSELQSIGRRRVRRERMSNWWSDFRCDLRFAVRSARRSPMFSLLAVMTLALGIGANAAILAAAKPLLFDPLPYAGQERLLRIYASSAETDRWNLTAGMVDELVRSHPGFSASAAFTAEVREVVADGGGQATIGKATWVEVDFFDTLGVRPMLGRDFSAEDLPANADTPASTVVLSEAAWQRHAGGARDAVGKPVMINGLPRAVIGVLPAGFVGPVGDADFYFPLDLSPTLADPVTVRRRHWLGLLARIAPDTSVAAASEQVAAIGTRLSAQYPDDFADIRAHAVPLRQAMVGDAGGPIAILLASAVLVLLIACTNLSGALLSRVLGRRKEFGVRAAIGAGRSRIARQLLTESLVLSLLGGIVGIVLAAALLALMRDAAAGALPYFAGLALDGGTVLVVFVLTLVTGLLVGALPALVIVRGDPQRALGDATRASAESQRSRRIRGLLVSGQIALCLSLIVGAGLLGRSLWNMSEQPTGVVSSGVVAATVQLPYGNYRTPEAVFAYQAALQQRLQALPGVASVAITTALPRAVDNQNSFVVDGAPWPPGQADPWALWSAVSEGYFQVLGIPLLAGRAFDARDHASAPPVVVINQAMARRFWPDGDAVGARIRIGPDVDAPPHEVIGVVGDVRNDIASSEAQAITYASIQQAPESVPSVLVRTHAEPVAMMRTIEREISAIDPAVPLRRVELLDRVLVQGLDTRRLPVMLMAAFGSIALLLATVGVYAMFASMTAAREHEFGVRMALGADRASIATLVLRQGSLWMAIGIAAGVTGVVGMAAMTRDLLFEVSPFDPLTLIGTTLLLATCATVASVLPLRRATSVDPAVILHSG